MCSSQCVLALLALYVGLAHSFSWDIAMASKHRIDFYFNGTLTHKEENPLANIHMITSDPQRNRVLFADGNSIYSFNTETETVEYILTLPKANTEPGMAYDLDSDQWLWSDFTGLYSMSTTKPNTEVRDTFAKDIAVDTKEGYIYWISTYPSINRARLNSSNEEMVIRYEVFKILQDLVIDPQTQRIYWTETHENYQINMATVIIKSADLNGNNIKSLYKTEAKIYSKNRLAVSKDYIYWQQYLDDRHDITGILWQLNKNASHPKYANAKQISTNDYVAVTTNYKIEDQTPKINNTEALAGLPEESLDDSDTSLLCIHGTPYGGESGCECDHGYTGERCEVFVCHNYCFGGECFLSGDGLPICRCNDGYTGRRCQTNLCNGYCLHDGVCSLSKYGRPVCKCTDDQYKGERCNVPTFLFKSYNMLSLLKDVQNAGVTYDVLDLRIREQDCPPFYG